MGNSRLPPFPHPTTVQPLVQIRQTLSLPGLTQNVHHHSATQAGSQSNAQLESVCLAACFARTRGWLAGAATPVQYGDANKRPLDSLFLMTYTGQLVEHLLEPHAKNTGHVSGDAKVTDDTPLDLSETPRAQWLLSRSVAI